MTAPDCFGPDTVFLHPDDFSRTLDLLRAVVMDRTIEGAIQWAHGGAYVDWASLTTSYLSSTEKAVVHIARGCAVLERSGGAAPRLRGIVADTVAAVAGVDDRDAVHERVAAARSVTRGAR